MILRLRYLLPLFFLLSFGILLTCWWIVNSQHFVTKAQILAPAITVDICLIIPLLYFLIIKKSRIPKLSVVAVFLLSLKAASIVLPVQNHEWILLFEYLLLPVELFIAGLILYKVQKGVKTFKENSEKETDTILNLRAIAAKESGSKLFGNVFGSELAIFYYLFFAKKEKKPVTEKSKIFTYHKRIAYPTTIVVFIFLILVETFALHLLLLRWHPIPAWIATLSSVYLIFFLIADVRAVLQRPIYFDKDFLYIRIGMRWYLKTPLVDIKEIMVTKKTADYKDCQKMVLFGDPNLLIRFNKPQVAIGLYGIKKKFLNLGIQIDDPERFAMVRQRKQ